LLGLWTITAPLTFGYGLDPAPLAREVWLNTQGRIWAMTPSDLVSGLLLVVFGCRSLTPGRPVSEWLGCGVGIWMSTVPVLFWTRTAAAYQLGYIDHVWDRCSARRRNGCSAPTRATCGRSRTEST
jgi:hypothetical protein